MGGYFNPPILFDCYIRLNIKTTVVQNLKNHGCCFYNNLKINLIVSEPFYVA